jgi:hypothetical protein
VGRLGTREEERTEGKGMSYIGQEDGSTREESVKGEAVLEGFF